MRKASLVLVIDDDATCSRMLAVMLKADGFGVLTAKCGREGRLLAGSQTPDLILLDRHMPEEDGLETCRLLKADSRTSQIPIIFVSIGQDVDTKVAAFEYGAVDYITKPYARAEVSARVRLHLQLHQAKQDLIEAQAARLRQLATAQEAMLIQPDALPEARFAVCRRPLHEVGGDFYDVVHIAENIWDYMIADVAGHDLESSLATAALKALVRQNAHPLTEPFEMVRLINAVMHRVYPEGPYVTMAYARINRSRMTLSLALAGHPPVIRTSADGRVETLAKPSDIVGAFETMSPAEFSMRLDPGDRLYFYTDGLIETDSAGSISRNEGLSRFARLCGEIRNQPLEKAASLLIEGTVPSSSIALDDLLLMAIEV